MEHMQHFHGICANTVENQIVSVNPPAYSGSFVTGYERMGSRHPRQLQAPLFKRVNECDCPPKIARRNPSTDSFGSDLA